MCQAMRMQFCVLITPTTQSPILQIGKLRIMRGELLGCHDQMVSVRACI